MVSACDPLLRQIDRAPSRSSRGSRRAADMRREHVLFGRVAEGDRRARDELVVRFMPLARTLALRYRGRGNQDDLIQVASVGLLKAIDRFDPDRKIAFSSYAVPTILGEVRRYFRDRTWAVKVPRGLQERSLRVDRAVRDLMDTLQRQPTIAEIATAIDADQEAVLEALQAGNAYRAASFDAPYASSDGDSGTLGDVVGVIEDGFDRAEDRATLQRLMVGLTARERDVLRMRFEQDRTQAEIGAIIGVSQMQISRIIRATLQRLRTVARAETQPADAQYSS